MPKACVMTYVCINVNSRCALNVLFTGVSVNMEFPAFQGKDSHVKKYIPVLCVNTIKYINKYYFSIYIDIQYSILQVHSSVQYM
jgi:hypothetical protein